MLKEKLPLTLKKKLVKFRGYKDVEYGESLVPKEKLDFIIALVQKQILEGVEGDIIECGMYKGGSTIKIAEKVRELNSDKLVFGLDAFGAFDMNNIKTLEDTLDEENTERINNKFSSLDVGKVYDCITAKDLYDIIIIRSGVFSDSLPTLEGKLFCFAFIDADFYLSVKQCIEFIKPRMAVGGIMFFDDYNAPSWKGANKAVDELIGKENIIELPKYQAYWINRGGNND